MAKSLNRTEVLKGRGVNIYYLAMATNSPVVAPMLPMVGL